MFDLKAIFAYLQTVPAVANQVPSPLGPDGKPMFAEKIKPVNFQNYNYEYHNESNAL